MRPITTGVAFHVPWSMRLYRSTRPTANHGKFYWDFSRYLVLHWIILYRWMRTQMLAKPSSNLLQRTGGDHRGGRAQLGWRTFMMTCLCWIMGYITLFLITSSPRAVDIVKYPWSSFYRAMLCIHGTSHGPVSVCLSVCHKSEFY